MPLHFQQFIVRADLKDAPVSQEGNFVAVLDSQQSVGDRQRRPRLRHLQFVERSLDQLLRFVILVREEKSQYEKRQSTAALDRN